MSAALTVGVKDTEITNSQQLHKCALESRVCVKQIQQVQWGSSSLPLAD